MAVYAGVCVDLVVSLEMTRARPRGLNTALGEPARLRRRRFLYVAV